MLSPSSISKLVKALTSVKLTSLAGLDDEDVIKGHLNFKRMEEIARELGIVLGRTKLDIDNLVKTIKASKTFTETDFLGHCTMHSKRICGCLACGFTPSEDES